MLTDKRYKYLKQYCKKILVLKGMDSRAIFFDDLFQEAILVFYNKVYVNDISLTCSQETFISSIIQNLFLKEINKKMSCELPDISYNYEYPEIDIKNKLFNHYYAYLSESNKKIVDLIIADTPTDIMMTSLNLKNKDVLKSKKNKVINKLKKLCCEKF